MDNIRTNFMESRIVFAGSSDEYGLIQPEDIPVKEDYRLRPLNPYGVSKAAQSLLGWQYYRSYDLQIIRTRTFSYSGPGQDSIFACSSFARQVVRIDEGEIEAVIRVGNLNAFRDYLDIRDIVRAYWLLSEKGESGEVYNVCSGKSIQMREILNMLLKLSSKTIKIEQNPELMRPSDIPNALGDNSKIIECTEWKPEITNEQMLIDLCAYWRMNFEKA